MSSHKRCLQALLLAVLACPLGALAEPLYSLTFLPADFYASQMNNAGQVVGTTAAGAAVWSSASSVTSLGLAGSEGLGINNLGQVVGRYGDLPFVYADGTLTTIPVPLARGVATGINDAGQVVGTFEDWQAGYGNRSPFLYANGSVTSIRFQPDVPEAGFAEAINNSGAVTGTLDVDGPWYDPSRQAYVFDGTLRTYGTLGGRISEGEDINDAGVVVGWSDNAAQDAELAFRLAPGGAMTDLGSLGGNASRAHALNNLGWIVGMSDIDAGMDVDYHAFLYREHGMVDLNSLVDPVAGWRLVSAEDINDAGQILAQACQAGTGDCRSVRLDLVSSVPEPSAWGMLLGGAGLIALAARRRRRQAAMLALPLLVAPLAAHAGPPPAFIPVFAPMGFEGNGINGTGQVVGRWNGAAAVWNGISIVDIGAQAPESGGLGINNRGDIAGYAVSGFVSWAFVRTRGALRDLGRLGQWIGSTARAVNDAGEVAGTGSWGVGERWRGWVYTQGTLRIIGTFGGDWSEVHAMNSHGQVVGGASTRFLYQHAFLYHNRVLADLGTLGGISSWANDINDLGQVVGVSGVVPDDTVSIDHPFLYENGRMRDLGTLGGDSALANGINDAGTVVGQSFTVPGDFTWHAFLYEQGRMRDLNALTAMPEGWLLVSARDINNSRQILAQACAMEDCVAVRLDPAPPSGYGGARLP